LNLAKKQLAFFLPGKKGMQDHCLQNKHCQTSGQGHCQTAPKLFKCAEGRVPSALLHLPKRRFDPYGFENRRKKTIAVAEQMVLLKPTLHADCSTLRLVLAREKKKISNSHLYVGYIYMYIQIYIHMLLNYTALLILDIPFMCTYVQLKILMHE
jgi:hypothetical protein